MSTAPSTRDRRPPDPVGAVPGGPGGRGDSTADAPAGGETESPRWLFVRAFVDNARARPGVEHHGVHPASIAFTALVALVLVLLAGVVWGVVRPRPAPTATAAPAPTGPASFTAVAGWDCTGGERSGFEATGRTAQWYTVASGGWTGDGCHGTFETIPMSGSATTEDPRQQAVWWFRPDETLHTCQLFVYLPAGVTAASTARYDVLAGRSGAAYATVMVDQTATPGRWLAAGTFPVSGEELAVRLGNRGVPAAPGAMLAVTQLRLDCSP